MNLPVMQPKQRIKGGHWNLGHVSVEVTTNPTVDVVVNCISRVRELLDVMELVDCILYSRLMSFWTSCLSESWAVVANVLYSIGVVSRR